VQRRRVSLITIRGCIVNNGRQTNSPSRSQIINHRRHRKNLRHLENKTSITLRALNHFLVHNLVNRTNHISNLLLIFLKMNRYFHLQIPISFAYRCQSHRLSREKSSILSMSLPILFYSSCTDDKFVRFVRPLPTNPHENRCYLA